VEFENEKDSLELTSLPNETKLDINSITEQS
jgi:hypothetical protein